VCRGEPLSTGEALNTPAPRRQRSRLDHYGPWILGGGALLAGIAYEAARHHVFTRFQLIFFLLLVPTIVVHEVSHGVVAYWCGDDTAKSAGRLTLNPIRHIDPIGSVLVPILLLVTTGSAFGWARPVPVSVHKLRHPRNQAVLVGLAGPFVNVLLALAAGFAFRGVADLNSIAGLPINSWPLGDEILFLFGEINVIIAVFNLIPIPPLDGSAVLERLMPRAWMPAYYRLRQLSIILVLFLVFAAPGALNSLFNHALIYWGNIVGL